MRDTRFVERFPLKDLTPADYNPRKIEPDAFRMLQESLRTFGVVKPVILNGNGILTAGHQRTKAMKAIGMEYCPAIIIEEVSRKDEIRFNLFHNSIETNQSSVNVEIEDPEGYGYQLVQPSAIHVIESENVAVMKEIAQLMRKYGGWGSVVTDAYGHIIQNAEYAIACKMMNVPLLLYRMKQHDVETLNGYMKKDYGSYHYETLGIKPYNQLHCQMTRLPKGASMKRSSTYEQHVLPNLQKHERLLDFGAGKMEYVTRLQKAGFQALGYEPHFQRVKTNDIDMKAIVKHIRTIEKDVKANGLYDKVVLDSVLNSITSMEFEQYVIATCNMFLKKDGTFYTGTRNLTKTEKTKNTKQATGTKRRLEFLDKDNFSATYRSGVWTLQKFHSKDSLGKLLSTYFKEVDVRDNLTQLHAICRKPREVPEPHATVSLEIELNMEYPNGFRHNKHERLKQLILSQLQERK